MIYEILIESDPDRSGSVSATDNASLATAIDRNKRENPSLQTASVPSPQEQARQKSGAVAQITVDGSKGGTQAVQNMNKLMATNPAIKRATDNGDAQIVVDYGRGSQNVSEQARKRIEEELRLNELKKHTIKTMDGKSFKEYLEWLKK